MKHYLYIPFLLLFIMAAPAQSQQKPVPGVGIRLGDDVATVRRVLKLDYDPEVIEPPPASRRTRTPQESQSIYKIRTKGIWIIFTSSGKVDTIRLEAPYAIPIAGISLGDSLGKVISTHGKPLPRSNMFAPGIYLYPLDDKAYVSFEVDQTDQVQMISIRR